MIYEEIHLTRPPRNFVLEATRCYLVTSTTIAVAAIATAAISAGVGAYAAVSAGDAQKDASDYQAGIDRNNAEVANQKATYEAERQRKRNLMLRGRQAAAYAKSGVEISGSAEDVMYDSEIEGHLDLLATRYAGRIAASDYQAKARLSVAQGQNAATAGYLGASASLLGGIGRGAQLYGNSLRNNPRF